MTATPTIHGLTDDDRALFEALWAQLAAKRPRNSVRDAYYDARNAIKLVTADTPQVFRQAATVLGWPAKAVDAVNNRCRLEGFVSADLDVDELGVTEIWDDNSLDTESSHVGLSALIHAVGWLVTTKGADGEPSALITARDAKSGTGLWDPRRRRLSAFLSVSEFDATTGLPVDLAIYTDRHITTAFKADGIWEVHRAEHSLRRVPVEPVAFKPRLGRPFGSSRISRPVMNITDLAMRTVLRSEVTAELYSVPQRVILGADESVFKNPDGSWKSSWQMAWAKILGVPVNEETGEVPEFKQLPQGSQEPHMAQLRSVAQLFAGETSIPETSLGVSNDANPTSAEAYFASREDLIGLSEQTAAGWSAAWRRSMITALEITHGVEGQAPTEWRSIRPKWRDPSHTSKAAASDAALKLIQAFPSLAESETMLELYGLDPITVDRLRADMRRGRATLTAQQLAEVASRVRAAN